MFKPNSLVLCDYNTKLELLKNNKSLSDTKYMTIDEFIKSYTFSYDEKSIAYLMDKYNIEYDIALEYLNNLYYVEMDSTNEKILFLKNIKNELIDNNLLIFNISFKNYIKSKNIIIYNHILTKYEEYVLSDINYEIENNYNSDFKHTVFEFNNIYEEIDYVARSISKLINDGVSINKIKLCNVSNDNLNLVKRIFSLYNLKINKSINIPIISTKIGKLFFDNLNNGIEEAIESISDYSNTDIYNQIISICNKYVWCNNNVLNKLIEYDLKNTYIKESHYTNEIEVVDFVPRDDYVFLLNFNEGIIPKTYKDEDYITDSIKPVYLDNTNDKNKYEKEKVKTFINNTKNIVITYSLNSQNGTLYPSSLIDDMKLEIEKKVIDCKESYSLLYDEILYSNLIDNYIKFKEKSDNLILFNSNYTIPYNTYSHKFTGVDKSKINNYIKSLSKFYLSYSSMDNYNRCAFRFYLEKILNIKKESNEFNKLIGIIYHYILENAKEDIDVEKLVYDYLGDKELKDSEKFFIDKIIKNSKILLEVVKEQHEKTLLKNIETEKKINIPIKDNINFIGFIDKIIYDEDVCALIDYKTYIKDLNLNYINSGIGMQLPIYMYLAKKSLGNIRFVGIYLQNIVFKNEDEDTIKESLKLQGLTNSDKDLVEKLDPYYSVNSFIKGIRVKNDGEFYSSTLEKMLTDEDIDNLISTTEEKIYETIDNIKNAKFDINPKYDGKLIGCDFCPYSDVCYKKPYDYVDIKKSLEYGGDISD